MNYELRELRHHLFHLADYYSIEIEDIPAESGTHMYIRLFNKIFMNPNEQRANYEFGLAHELGHAIYGDPEGEAYYSFSLLLRNEEEKSANANAIRIISNFVYRDTPVEARNWKRFMDGFNLPNSLEDLVKEIIAK